MLKPISNKIYKRAGIELFLTLFPLLCCFFLVNNGKTALHSTVLEQIFFLFTGIIGLLWVLHGLKGFIIAVIITLIIRSVIIWGVLIFAKSERNGLALFLSFLNFITSVLLALLGISFLIGEV